MQIIKKFMVNHYKAILFCILISLFFSYPLFNSELIVGHDLFFHLGRIEGVSSNFELGQFIVKLYPYHNYGFGYANPLFYCDILIYPAAILYYFGTSILISYKMMLVFYNILMAFSMYYCVFTITKNKYASVISVTLYTFCSYHIIDVYTRAALGEIFALTFLPLVIAAIYIILVEHKDASILFGSSMALLLMSHNITFVLMCIVLMIIVIVYCYKIYKYPKLLWYILKAALIGIGLSAFFLFPMLEQMLEQNLVISTISGTTNIKEYSLQFVQIFMNSGLTGIAGVSNNLFTFLTANLGVLVLTLPFMLLFSKKIKDRELNTFLYTIFVIGCVFVIFTTNLVDWDKIQILSFIQFSWRLNVIVAVLFSVVAGISCIYFFDKANLKVVSFCILMVSVVLFNQVISSIIGASWQVSNEIVYPQISGPTFQNPNPDGTLYNGNELMGAEYLPANTTIDYSKHSGCVYYLNDDDAYCEISKIGNNITVYPSNDENETIVFPKTYYKGYQVYGVNYNDNKLVRIPFEIHPDHNTIMINTGEYDFDEYRLVYESTVIQKVTLYISIITMLYIIITTIIKRCKLKK